jgi:peptidoglycan/LPS O-acetylase OafA/YrhL
MSAELWGSLFVYGLLGLAGSHPRLSRIAAVAAIGFVLLGKLRLAVFPAGLALAALKRDRPGATLGPVATVAFAAGAYALGGAYHLGEFRPLTFWPGGFDFQWEELVTGAAAVLTVAIVLFSPPVARVLTARPLVWLGKISFGLYLVHLPIILSLGAFVFVRTLVPCGHGVAFAVASLAVFAVSLPAAWLMTALVDGPAVRLCHRLGRLVARP